MSTWEHGRVAAKVLNLLVSRRPEYLSILAICGRVGVEVPTARNAIKILKRLGLIEFTDERRVLHVAPQRSFRATDAAVQVEVPPHASTGRPRKDGRLDKIYAELARGQPVTILGLARVAGVSDTLAGDVLRRMLKTGEVTRELGPETINKNQRTWLWTIAERQPETVAEVAPCL